MYKVTNLFKLACALFQYIG